jgi:hypothetical protein
MSSNFKVINGEPTPIGNRVLVTDMHFGEQKTASGLIIKDDNGTTRGVYPRWAKVYKKGPDNNDPYEVGQWILIEHGRWTRGFTVKTNVAELEIRMAEAESVLGYSDKKPDGIQIGGEYADGEHATIDPSSFINA